MWDTVNRGWQPQPWHHNIIEAQPYPIFSKVTPTCTRITAIRMGVPICPSTALQGAKTLCIHPTWMWDAVNEGLQPQPWHHNIIQAWPYPPPSTHVLQHTDAPICPSTASQGAITLCIHPTWMWDAINGGRQPQPWHYNIIHARPYPVFPKTH